MSDVRQDAARLLRHLAFADKGMRDEAYAVADRLLAASPPAAPLDVAAIEEAVMVADRYAPGRGPARERINAARRALAIAAYASPPAAPLDVERLADAIRNVYIAPSASRDMDAENIAAEYARLTREGEQPVAGPDAPGSRPSTRHEHSEE